jgi:hypothetical protein
MISVEIVEIRFHKTFRMTDCKGNEDIPEGLGITDMVNYHICLISNPETYYTFNFRVVV